MTVVTHQRQCLFGKVVNARSTLNDAGTMVHDVWAAIPHFYPGTALDSYVVMPDHLHGILWIEATAPPVPQPTLPSVMRSFKSLTTSRYAIGVRQQGWHAFEQRLWQRSFYDRVVRHEQELAALRDYIATNPVRWTLGTIVHAPQI